MLALMAPLMSAYNTIVTSCDARKSTEIAISKLAIQSFYKLNGIFATSLLAHFRRAIQIGNLVDVLDMEDKVWRVGKVEKSIGADNAERRSIVVSLRGFSDEHNITLNHLDFRKDYFHTDGTRRISCIRRQHYSTRYYSTYALIRAKNGLSAILRGRSLSLYQI